MLSRSPIRRLRRQTPEAIPIALGAGSVALVWVLAALAAPAGGALFLAAVLAAALVATVAIAGLARRLARLARPEGRPAAGAAAAGEERLHDSAVASSEARILDVLENMPQAIALFDAEDRLVLLNRQCLSLFGERTRLLVRGSTFEAIVRDYHGRGGYQSGGEGADDFIAQRLALHREAPSQHERMTGDGRWLRIDEHRTADGGTIVSWTDITDLHHRENEMRAAKEAADDANRAKSWFLATMSHELRTPLNAIIGFSEAMMAGLFGPIENARYAGYVRDIHRSGHHLLAIINDILDLSKIEAGGFQVTEGIVDLTGVLGEVVELMRPRAAGAGIALALDLPEGLPLLLADARAIKQIVLNLVSNAVKFTHAGGRVEVAVQPVEAGLSLIVRDTGIGMAEEDIAKALEPFVQLEGPLSRRYHGTGLGLPIVKALVDLHGGRLEVASRPGEGTAVTVRLPQARVLRSGGPASAVLDAPSQPLISRAASTAP